MKQKLLDALKQGHKNLGLSEEAFERVATFGETFITEEGQIETFVRGASGLLKAEQSAADKVRSELNTKIKALEGEKADLEAKLKGGDNKPDKVEPETQPNPQDFAKLIAEAVAGAIKPVQDELAKFKGEQAAKKAFIDAESAFKSDGYVKKYADEASDAWERAIEVNELTGNKMTAEELTTKAKGYFTKLVARKGVDTSKPFDGDGNGDDTPDFAHFDRAAEELGLKVNN